MKHKDKDNYKWTDVQNESLRMLFEAHKNGDNKAVNSLTTQLELYIKKRIEYQLNTKFLRAMLIETGYNADMLRTDQRSLFDELFSSTFFDLIKLTDKEKYDNYYNVLNQIITQRIIFYYTENKHPDYINNEVMKNKKKLVRLDDKTENKFNVKENEYKNDSLPYFELKNDEDEINELRERLFQLIENYNADNKKNIINYKKEIEKIKKYENDNPSNKQKIVRVQNKIDKHNNYIIINNLIQHYFENYSPDKYGLYFYLKVNLTDNDKMKKGFVRDYLSKYFNMHNNLFYDDKIKIRHNNREEEFDDVYYLDDYPKNYTYHQKSKTRKKFNKF